MAPQVTVRNVTQQIQRAAQALEGSLPELAGEGVALLQDAIATLVSGAQGGAGFIASRAATLKPGRTIAAAADLGTDVATTSLNNPLSVQLSPDSQPSSLESFRAQFRQDVSEAIVHIGQDQQQQQQGEGRQWRVDLSESPLGNLVAPWRGARHEGREAPIKRPPLLKV